MKMKAKKMICLILIIILGGIFFNYLLVDDTLRVDVLYGPDGTTQTSGIFEYGTDTSLHSQDAQAEGFRIAYKVRCNIQKNDILQMNLGDCGGTIKIEEICINYHNSTLKLRKNDIEKYFKINGIESMQKENKCMELFTYNAGLARLSADDYLMEWLKRARSGCRCTNIVGKVLIYSEIIVLLALFACQKNISIRRMLYKRKLISYMMLYVMVFAIYFMRLFFRDSMIAESGDATSIWNTITTFYSDNIESSYVLYKGMFSVYPYVWLYQLACFFGTNEFLFVKIYNAMLFAYIAGIGMPYIFEKIFGKDAVLWKKWLFAVSMFHLQAVNYAFYNITIDMPCLFCFVLMMDMCALIWKGNRNFYVREIIVAGITGGAAACFSGQYKLGVAAGLVLIVLVFVQKKKIRQAVVSIILFFLCFSGVGLLNKQFNTHIVEPMRESGEWIPSADQWIRNSLTRKRPILGAAYLSSGELHDSQAIQIIESEKPDYTKCTNTMDVIIQYFGVVLKYPMKYCISCGNKLFLAFCIDAGGSWSFFSLGVGFWMFYIGIIVFIQRYFGKRVPDKAEYIIVLAFALIILPPCALHMELRYAMGIQQFVYGFGIFGVNMDSLYLHKKNKWILLFIASGLIFTTFCIMHYMALLD